MSVHERPHVTHHKLPAGGLAKSATGEGAATQVVVADPGFIVPTLELEGRAPQSTNPKGNTPAERETFSVMSMLHCRRHALF